MGRHIKDMNAFQWPFKGTNAFQWQLIYVPFSCHGAKVNHLFIAVVQIKDQQQAFDYNTYKIMAFDMKINPFVHYTTITQNSCSLPLAQIRSSKQLTVYFNMVLDQHISDNKLHIVNAIIIPSSKYKIIIKCNGWLLRRRKIGRYTHTHPPMHVPAQLFKPEV